ncbi:MAG: NAD(+)/NADH kinase [bacterium]
MKFGIVANTTKAQIWGVLPDFLTWLESKGPSVLVSNDLQPRLNIPKAHFLPASQLAAECDMILSFGGDGTLLSTARLVGSHQTPILGINLGGLGYLAESSLESLHPRIEDLLSGNYRVEDRMVLRCQVNEGSKFYYALNDIVIDKGAYSRVVRIRTTIGGRYLNTYICDGLIVSTPTGSTAYSLSTGGPIVEPALNALIINPISPHTLANRPMVIGDDREVEAVVESGFDGMILAADGQVEQSLRVGDRVRICRADYVVKLVLFPDKFFFDVLREKLNWGAAPAS